MYFYKIGNMSDVILRSVDASAIGSHKIKYDYEPYTILKDKEIEINFKSITKELKGSTNVLQFNQDYPEELVVKNVELNDKILNLLYKQTAEGICTEYQNCVSDEEGIIYLNNIKDHYYQIFIFNEEGNLESAYGESTESQFKVENTNSSYLIVYGFMGEKNYTICPIENIYFSIDIISKSNSDDVTLPTYYHFDKCALEITKDMYFNNNANTVDLKFKILDLDNSTISLN